MTETMVGVQKENADVKVSIEKIEKEHKKLERNYLFLEQKINKGKVSGCSARLPCGDGEGDDSEGFFRNVGQPNPYQQRFGFCMEAATDEDVFHQLFFAFKMFCWRLSFLTEFTTRTKF